METTYIDQHLHTYLPVHGRAIQPAANRAI